MNDTSWMDRSIGALIACVALGLCWTGSLWSQDTPFAEPVPVDLLRDGELVVPSRNFAIATPPGDWKWFLRKGRGATPSQATYICKETESGAEFQVISSGLAARFDTDFVAGVKEGMRESLADGGLRIKSLEMTESMTPLPHCFRSQWQASLPDGRLLNGYSYLTASDTVFTIQHITTDEAEPPLFTQFAGTFRSLRTAAPPVSPCFWGMVELLLVGVAYIVAVAVNRGGGRSILNGGTLGAALVIILVVVLVAIGAYTGLARDLPPETLGRVTGRRIGEALIPLLIAVFISRAHRKRKASLNETSGGSAGETPR